jgi:eukaryotic-like serine/threonine-protein kinase
MFKPGDLLDDRYLITGDLGQGGMAYVFRAKDQHLDREVALKVLRPHLTETDQERFRREIKTLARLSHPGIVTIYDLGRGQHVYFAMELVEGGLFTDLGPLEPDPEPFQKLLTAAISVAETLNYVHKLGVIHRDLTPRNILLTTNGHPKVMDFGLVQLAESSRELTRTGLTLGTPQYMAPEQAKGEGTGTHTDIYAFGAVLYKAVTGVNPFDADNDQAILYQHVYGSVESVTNHNPFVPKDLTNLIAALLAKNPEERPGSASEVAQMLRSILYQAQASLATQRLAGPAQQGVYLEGPINARTLQPFWQVKLPEGPQWPSSLTAAEGFFFVGLPSEEVRVLRPADGSTQSRFAAPDEVNVAPLYVDGHLLLVSRDGSLSALRWPKGEMLWSDPDASVVGAVPMGSNLLVSTRNNGLEHRSLGNEILWRYEAESPAMTPPVVHKLNACFVTQEGWVHSVDASTGKGKFKIQLGSVAATPSAKDGILLLPERSGELHAFDLEKREVKWSYDLEGALWASPICWGKYVYAVSWSNVVRCLSLKTGDDIWEYDLQAQVTATPIIAAGVLYIVTESGQLVALEAQTGKVLFEDTMTLNAIQASPLVLGDTLIVAALDGTVKAYKSS